MDDETLAFQALTRTVGKVDALIAAAKARMAAAEAELKNLELQKLGIAAAIEAIPADKRVERSIAGTPNPAVTPPSTNVGRVETVRSTNDGPGLSDRVLNFIHAAGRPVALVEVAENLPFEKSQVRSAIGYLNRKGQLKNEGRGLWSAAPTNAERASGDTEALSDSVPSSKEGGGASGTDSNTVRDHNSLWQADDLDQRHGAPLVGVAD